MLTPQETDGLFRIMRTLLDRGVSIIFISHKLKEVVEITDAITVLRRGRVAGHADPKTSTPQSLASLMVGRDVVLQVDKSVARPGGAVLTVQDLFVHDDRDIPTVKGVDLTVYHGEITGIAGVQGNGQTELIEAIVGLRRVEAGYIELLGQDITGMPVRDITMLGTGHVPEDRQKMGMIGSFPVKYNMVLNDYFARPYSSGILMNEAAIEADTEKLMEAFDVRPRNIFSAIRDLSGGNQQKVIVAREFSRQLKLLVVAQPTRGLDVGSIEYIHRQIIRLRDEGVAVLLVSAELDEILSLSDRVAVMYDGQIIDVLTAGKATRERVGLLMAGHRGALPAMQIPEMGYDDQ